MNPSIVSNLLKEGMMVGVRIGANAPWHGNIIYAVNGSTVKLAFIEKFMKDSVLPGNNIWIKYSNDYYIYYFSGKVSRLIKEPSESVLVELEHAEEMINNRLFPRYDVRLQAKIKPVWDNEIYECTVTDLSYGGAAFVCEHKFDSNEYIEMNLSLTNGSTVNVSGKVVRRRSTIGDLTDHAAQFIECDNKENKQLSEYFGQLEDEASEIYRKYEEKRDTNSIR
ncbi:MAG TPA: PilZ domain-containing protein [Clostridia bacterium]|nr:PilZ domain-containing protein [Clostridia bacterium]